jgi:hypothetical protein
MEESKMQRFPALDSLLCFFLSRFFYLFMYELGCNILSCHVFPFHNQRHFDREPREVLAEEPFN